MDFRISFALNTIPLYRIMPLKWFKVMIKKKSNTLFRPSIWNDPYETSYSNSVIVTDKGKIPLDASHWFGQCWSLCQESAIMWQALKNGEEPYVKIKIDANSLVKNFTEKDNYIRIAVLEHIRYFNPIVTDYEEKIKDVMMSHQWTKNFISKGVTPAELYPIYNLLTKRSIFKHEEEVRLLLFDKSTTEEQKSVTCPFDPASIKEVIIDPWTSNDNNKCNNIEEELRQYFSSETTISKSKIFSDSSKFSITYNLY